MIPDQSSFRAWWKRVYAPRLIAPLSPRLLAPFSSLLISVKNKQIFYIFCRDFDLCKVLTVVEVSGSSCSVTNSVLRHPEPTKKAKTRTKTIKIHKI